jgi:hypothetical protein
LLLKVNPNCQIRSSQVLLSPILRSDTSFVNLLKINIEMYRNFEGDNFFITSNSSEDYDWSQTTLLGLAPASCTPGDSFKNGEQYQQ